MTQGWMSDVRVLGRHAGCGGDVLYQSTSTRGWRTCTKCGADGEYGRPSPDTEDEMKRMRMLEGAS